MFFTLTFFTKIFFIFGEEDKTEKRETNEEKNR